MKLVATVLLAAFAACQSASSRAPETSPVTAELVADTASIRSGQTFTVGVLLKMKPQWHVYWKNPGDSGAPVQVAMKGPDGFTFGEIQWPVPIEFDQPGDIVGYGYTETVMFPITVTAPKALAAGGGAKITADVRWLCCKDVCIPGRASLDVSLPTTSDAPAPANSDLFAAWRAKLPAAATSDLATSKVSGKVDPATRKGAFEIAVDWKTPPSKVEWFPEADPALAITNVKVSTDGGRSRIAFDAEVFEGQSLTSSDVGSLVVFTDAGGARRGLPVVVHLQ